MANWQRTLDLTPWWNNTTSKSDTGTIEPQEACRRIAEGLRNLAPFSYPNQFVDELKANLADNFEFCSTCADTNWDEFDGLMDELYNWGDMPLDQHFAGKKVCWIKTF